MSLKLNKTIYQILKLFFFLSKSMIQKMCQNMTELDNNDFVEFGKQLDIFSSKIPKPDTDVDEIYFNEMNIG